MQYYLAAGLSKEEKDLLWRVKMVEECAIVVAAGLSEEEKD